MRRVLASLLALTIALGAPALAGAVTLAGLDESSSGHDWSTNLFFSRMEERTGVPIELNQYKTASEWTAAKAAMLSGDPSSLPEVLFKAALTEQETLGLYQSGVLIDLKPYLAENAPNLCALFQKHPDWEQAVTLPGGAIAALPLINELPTNNAVWVNQTWLEALGLSMPETAEEFASMLRAFKTGDPNRNGRSDEIPLTFTGIWDLRWLSHAFGFVSDDYYLYLDDTGIVHSVLPTEQNKAFLSWLNGLWNEGLLDRNGLVTSSTSRAITDSNAEIRFGAIIGPTPLTMVPASALDDYDLMFPLVSGAGRIFRSFPGPLTRGTFALTSACSDPAAMLRWVDYLYGSEGSRFLQAGEEGVEYELHGDSSWSWIAAPEEVSSVIMPSATIVDGTPAPGLLEAEFQLGFDHASTHALAVRMQELSEYCLSPMPAVYLSPETRARVNELQLQLGACADAAMNRFVMGEIPITDQTWQSFCDELNQKGLDEMVSLWQQAIDSLAGSSGQ